MFETLELPFVQQGMLEIAALAVGAGLLGTWIVLRGIAFFAHAVGTAAFPGLVLAEGLGFAAVLGALGTAAVVALAVAWLAARRPQAQDSATALVLVAAVAIGVVLASDVFSSSAAVDQLLFGSLLLVDDADVALAAAVSAAALVASLLAGPRWLAAGFEGHATRADTLLLALVALAAVAVLDAVGALLATALLVVPAATTRLVCERLRTWQVATVGLVLAEGLSGLVLSVELNAPPGATIAVLGGAVFALVALWRSRRGVAAAAAALIAVGASGCGDGAASGDRTQVVASTTVVADLVREVAGDTVEVRTLMGPNADPHDYEPRPADVRALGQADLVVLSGLGLDHALEEAAEVAGARTVLVLGDTLPDPVDDDPHWWQDPRATEATVHHIADRLDADAAPFLARLRELDTTVARCMSRVPAAQRKLVTDHDAFGWFARRYAVDVVGAVIPASTTQAQPNAGDIAALSRTIRRKRVRTVFPEQALSRRLVEAIARQTGARVGGALFADALGKDDTYLGAMTRNADVLVNGMTAGAQRCRS